MELISGALRLDFREFCVGMYKRQIDDIFQMADIQPGTISPNRQQNLSGERRTRVEEYYASLDWTVLEDVQKFLKVLELVLSQSYVPEDSKNFIRELCSTEGLIVEKNSVLLPERNPKIVDLFAKQFPVGLPFGVNKPDFSITAKSGSQSLMFELKTGMGIIWQNVYPNFDFETFQAASGISSDTNSALKKALVAMNQTENEKYFFIEYARLFKMADKFVPMLIPQAWIQWHSLTKRALRASKRTLADELYRVDFVAFWQNQRYAILIDDISHYGVKEGQRWIADEETYSKRLQEDRSLQAEGWRIFRVSNWEIRQKKTREILADLQLFLGF
ncbi:MAG: hypothetical protein H6652_17435 [Ardenticatenaceae bacterium]|nr:hypothetical protein [Ardenticatenaceae bacterium]MCB8949676.1 hypothetical protein [Ardenticatenaceae bacterium]